MKSQHISTKLHSRIDLIGAILAVACGIHCIALPILLVILPLVGLSFLLNETLEKVFVVAAIFLAAFNLCWGYSIHKKVRVLFLFLAASVMLISGMFIWPHTHSKASPIHEEHSHELTGEVLHEPHLGERPQDNPLSLLLLVIGAGAICASHLLNRRLCHSCVKCKTSECK